MYNQKLVKECQAFVDTYTASILEFLANGATPKEVWLKLKVFDIEDFLCTY